MLEFKTPGWLDNILCGTNGTIDEHEREVREVLTKLQNACGGWNSSGITFTERGLNLLTDHQALQPLLKRKRAHKQYSARLTWWLDRLSRFDVNVQLTAGENFPLTDYLSRHPIVNTGENAAENNFSCENEAESEEEFVINQTHGLFDFIQTNGSIKDSQNEPNRNKKLTNHSAAHASVIKIKQLIRLNPQYH